MLARICTSIPRDFVAALDRGAPAFDLIVRLWAAGAFWLAGLARIGSMPAAHAAAGRCAWALPGSCTDWAVAVAEIVLPALLAFGLGARLAALGLLCLALPALAAPIDLPGCGPVTIAVLLLPALGRGPGRWSIDRVVRGRFLPPA